MITNSLQKIQNLARDLLDKYGLYNWNIDFCNAKQLQGKALLQDKMIIISRIHAIYEQNIEQIKDTILHEIAHALDYEKRGLTNHDKHWKKIANTIGCNPKRTGTVGSQPIFNRKELCKWISECPRCGNQDYRHRRRNLACRNCCDRYNNGRYTRKYQLIYHNNPHYINI